MADSTLKIAAGLVVLDLTKTYPTSTTSNDRRTVLDKVSLTVAPGEILVLLGPSGSGKSTLLNIIGGLDTADSGSVLLGGRKVTTKDEDALATYRHRHVGFVFQDHHLLPHCTALENILLPMLAGGGKANSERGQKLLAQIGLTDRAGAFPAELSGGERQRVAIARAFVMQPPLLLCDEPTGNLDGQNERLVAEMIRDLVSERRAICVLVTHNQSLAAGFSRRVEINDGKLRTIS